MSAVLERETPQAAARRLAGPAIRDGYKPTGLHAYTDTQGEVLFWRVRAKHANGDKWIRPMKLDGEGFVLREPPFEQGKPLYRLHRITQDLASTVWIVEGEQKVDALEKLGLLATTSGGASSADVTDWRPLAKRDCVIWPDNDAAGRQYAETVRSILVGLGASVSVIDAGVLGLADKGDAVDWLAAHQGATRSNVEALPRTHSMQRQESASTGPCVELLRGDSIKPEAVSWLWNGYLVGGKVNIFAGAPGTGKTTLALAMAATVTIGGRWPDGTRTAQGDVLIWSGEDAPADTLVPRLLACGADMRRVRFVGRVRDGETFRAFDPAQDLAELRLAMLDGAMAWKLLIVDSIVSATSGDSHKNAEVRRGLEPLGALADETGCAILGITHFTKGTSGREPLERVTGSLAFGAYARIVLATAKRDREQGGGRIVTRAKSNLGPDGGGFVYDIEQIETPGHPGIFASRVRWGDAIEGTAREILADAEAQADDGEGGTIADAKAFLVALLTDGPVSSKQVRQDADGAGYSWATIRRAQKALGVEPVKEGLRAGWVWRMPSNGSPNPRRRSTNSEAAQQNTVSTFGKNEHLRVDDVAEIEGTL